MFSVGTAAMIGMQRLVEERNEALAAAQLGLCESQRAGQSLQQRCDQLEQDAATLRSADTHLASATTPLKSDQD